MDKKSRQNPQASKLQEFRSTPFTALKGVQVQVASSVEAKPAKPVAVTQVVVGEEDAADLFLQAMGGVRRLEDPTGIKLSDGDKKVSATCTASKNSKHPPLSISDPAASTLFLQEIGRLKLEVKFSEQFPDEDELKPLSGNRLRQLKRGVISVDHQLDLHGLTRDEALFELPRFIKSARLKGQSAALVITGKGLNSPGEPVLQQAVAGWLRDAGREHVVEYAPAPREMGGSGAFVVFLRPMVNPVPSHS
jgi:DNA-nicking Smr family endonuclease